MNLLLVYIFVAILLYTALVLLARTLSDIGQGFLPKHPKLQTLLSNLQSESYRTSTGYIAFLVALWNFFGPDFSSSHGGLTIIGALVPSIVLLIDSFILSPTLREKIPFPHKYQEKLDYVVTSMAPFSGWLTLIVALVHAVAYKAPFL